MNIKCNNYSHLDFPLLSPLEDDVRGVEHDRLQEEDERDPLVVGLDLDEVFVRHVRTNPSADDLFPDLGVEVHVVLPH